MEYECTVMDGSMTSALFEGGIETSVSEAYTNAMAAKGWRMIFPDQSHTKVTRRRRSRTILNGPGFSTLLLAIAMMAPAQAETNASTRLQAAAPQKAVSPLLVEERRLLASPVQVKFEVMRRSSSKEFRLTFQEYARIDSEQADAALSEKYYIAAIRRATLLIRGEDRLFEILNSYGLDPNVSAKQISLQFEQTYFDMFGVYPDMVPVDTQAILDRLLSSSTIR
jgi:hypothetical protein